MSTPLILATTKFFKTKVDVLGFPTWKGSTNILRHDCVNSIFEKNAKLPWKYDLVLETWWGGYGQQLEYSARQIIRSERPDYLNQHEIEQNMSLIQRVGYSEKTPGQYVYYEDVPKINNKKYVGLHSGCFGGAWQKKQYSHFEKLAIELLKDGFEVINFGTEKETINIQDDNFYNNAGNFDLQGTVNYISSCDYFIANDSGLMHIADALNIPLIALFGPTLIVKNKPANKDSHVLNGNLPCQPCQYTENFNTCKENKCLSGITVDHIIDLMKELKWIKNM